MPLSCQLKRTPAPVWHPRLFVLPGKHSRFSIDSKLARSDRWPSQTWYSGWKRSRKQGHRNL